MRIMIVITMLAMFVTACATPAVAVPALTPPTPAPPPAATPERTQLDPGPAILQDKLVYFRTSGPTLSTATAIPKDANDTFLVIVFGLLSNSNIYPADIDWTVVDQGNLESECVGFGIPLQAEQTGAAVFSLFGPLIKGPVPVSSSGDRAAIVLIFVVPKGMATGSLFSPQGKTFTFSVVDPALRLDNAMLSTLKIDGSFVGQPNGSEKWIITP